MAATLSFAAVPQQLQGDIIPDFFFNTLDGSDVYRDDFKDMQKPGTKRVVLSFFTTWCAVCMEEFAHLKKNAAELEKQGVQVYLVNMFKLEKESPSHEKVKEFATKYAGETFPIYIKNRGDFLEKDFGLKSVFPAIIIMDANLRVLKVLSSEIGSNFPGVLWSE
jgi:thiol-disulfide isomerase/thioredoxin